MRTAKRTRVSFNVVTYTGPCFTLSFSSTDTAYSTKIDGITDTVEVAIIDNSTQSIQGDVIPYVPVGLLPCLVALVTGFDRNDDLGLSYLCFRTSLMSLIHHYDPVLK